VRKKITLKIYFIFLIEVIFLLISFSFHAQAFSQERVKGFDVISWQPGQIDWDKLRDGYSFLFTKATQGINWERPGWEENIKEALDSGILVGVYHFAMPVHNNAKAEGEFFANSFNRILEKYPESKKQFLRPALDIEDYPYQGKDFHLSDYLTKVELSNWIREWMNTVKNLTNIEPILYVVSPYYQGGYANYLEDYIAQYNLWISDHRSNITSPDTGVWGKIGIDWDFWQWKCETTIEYVVPERTVDLDWFNGDMSRLRTFAIAPPTRFMDFEDGVDGAVIRSKIPGMTFTSTEGYDWIYSDIRTGKYNYPFYWVNGNFCAWLGPYQGVGRIDFTGATAKTISLSYSGYYTVYLEAYDSQGNLIDSVSGPPNTGTGKMDRLSVSGLNIAYVLIHDLGNYWIIDDLEVNDLLAETRVNLPANFAASHEEIDTVNQGESKWKLFLNKIIQTMRIILGWSGSELSIRVYRPDGTFYNEYQSDTSPIIIDIKNAEPGEWQFEVVAKDVPRSNYPFALIVGLPDVDGDGKADQDDNCPNTYNPDQADSNKNGIGNACEIIPGDLDNDGDVDQNDLNILLSYRNKPASTCPKCDLDGDGMITVLDGRKLVLLCTRPGCATE